jgi:hypothetical protein
MLVALREISSPAPPTIPTVSITAPSRSSTLAPPEPPLSPQDEPKTIIDERVSPEPTSFEKDKTPGPPERVMSHESLVSSSASEVRRTDASEVETEEDEGMILVGRPSGA